MLCISLFVYAFGNNVSVAQEEIDKSKRFALIIGIGQYERKDDVNPLRFAVRDATAVRDALTDQQAGTFWGDHVLLLTDTAPQEPTKSNILESLAVLKNKTQPEDTLLIFFSGHGYQKGKEIYLLPQDAKFLILEDTAIPLTVWKERIAEIPAQTKIIILDACHSGGVEKKKGGIGEMTSEFEQSIAPSAFDFGQAVLSSSKQEEASFEDEDSGHGVFTRYLLESLSGQGDTNGDKIITLKEVSDYVEQKVRAWGAQHGKSQTPCLKSSLTEDVVLALATSAEEAPQSIQFIPMPTAPYDKDKYTIHLWHLDGNLKGVKGVGKSHGKWTKGKFGLGLHLGTKGTCRFSYSEEFGHYYGFDFKEILPEGSLEFWLKVDSIPMEFPMSIISIDDWGLSLFMRYGILRLSSRSTSVPPVTLSPQNVVWEPGIWYHIATVWMDNIIRLYVNGKLEAISQNVPWEGKYDLNLGQNTLEGNFTIDEIRVSNIARIGNGILSDTNGWLGVFITEVSEVLARDVGLPNTDGVLVTQVEKGGPADKAGLVLGDVILEFNGKKVRNLLELMISVAEVKVGSVVPVTINRDGVEKVIPVKIERRPPLQVK